MRARAQIDDQEVRSVRQEERDVAHEGIILYTPKQYVTIGMPEISTSSDMKIRMKFMS